VTETLALKTASSVRREDLASFEGLGFFVGLGSFIGWKRLESMV